MSQTHHDIGQARQEFTESRAALARIIDDCFALDEELSSMVTTSDADEDVAVTHDSHGRLVELWVEPAVAQQLTVEELEDRINEALANNVQRGTAEYNRIFNGFLAQYESESWRKFREKSAANEMAAALHKAQGGQG